MGGSLQCGVERCLEADQEEQDKKKLYQSKMDDVGKDKNTGAVGFSSQALIEKIQSTQRKWKVLESDSEDIDGNIKVIDDDAF